MSIAGPFKPTGAGDTPSRRQIFTCKPASAAEEPACARQIISKLARKAYRRSVTQADLDNLVGFYQRGRNEGGNFESGIEAAIQLILASPDFLFRFEPDRRLFRLPAFIASAIKTSHPGSRSFSGAQFPMKSF